MEKNSGMRILTINTNDIRGGAARIAWTLHQSYLQRGLEASMAVGRKDGRDPSVQIVPNEKFQRFHRRTFIEWAKKIRGSAQPSAPAKHFSNLLLWLAEPERRWEKARGGQDFYYPGTRALLGNGVPRPDLIHCHNLHGGFFDLRMLPQWSKERPVVFTLHDAWLLSGLCHYAFDCERWKIGCGDCPYLSRFTKSRIDSTAGNWQQKQKLYRNSRFYVATPSQWLMDSVKQSMLQPAIADQRVIPNGIDLEIFKPADKAAVREQLGLPQNARILLFTAEGVRGNLYKDYHTIQKAVRQLAEQTPERLVLLALGEDGVTESWGKAEIRFCGFLYQTHEMVKYYQAADVYLHAAHADNFPNVVLEALACGCPVVATAVGGIPEQIHGLDWPGATAFKALENFPRSDVNRATGLLVPYQEGNAMAEAVLYLFDRPQLMQQLADNAARDARRRFDAQRMIQEYLSWYQEILVRQQSH